MERLSKWCLHRNIKLLIVKDLWGEGGLLGLNPLLIYSYNSSLDCLDCVAFAVWVHGCMDVVCVCACVYMCVCVCVCMCVCACVCVCICVIITKTSSLKRYRAPECLLTDGIYGYKMDMWSVGCVMYEVLR